jgi:DNA-binding NarL/FixJ family response regulator
MRRASSVSTAANTAISSMSMVRRVLEKYPDQFFSSREQVSTNVGISDSGISLAHEREMCPRSSTQKLAHITEALTPREQEVLRLVAQGMRNAQVAHQLVMSVGTVRTHLESIYSKLGVANRTAAAHYAQEHHLF